MITGRHLGARQDSDAITFDTFMVPSTDVLYKTPSEIDITVKDELDHIEQELELYILKSQAITMIELKQEYEYQGEIMSGLLLIYGDDNPPDYEHRVFIPIEGGFGMGQTVNLVLQNLTAQNLNYPILLVNSPSQASGTEGAVNYASNVSVNPSEGSVTATTFKGNATTASSFNTTKSIIIDLSKEKQYNSFKGDSDTYTFGVKNILPVLNGGTGNETGERLVYYGNCTDKGSVLDMRVTAKDFPYRNGSQICVYFSYGRNEGVTNPKLTIDDGNGGYVQSCTMYDMSGSVLGGSSFKSGMYHFVYYNESLYQCKIVGVESAASLTTKRSIDGVPFDGTGDVSHYVKDTGADSFTIDCNSYPQVCPLFYDSKIGSFINIEFTKDYSSEYRKSIDVTLLNIPSSYSSNMQVELKQGGNGYFFNKGIYTFVKDSANSFVEVSKQLHTKSISTEHINKKRYLYFSSDEDSTTSTVSSMEFSPRVYFTQNVTGESTIVADFFSGTLLSSSSDHITNIDGIPFSGSETAISRYFTENISPVYSTVVKTLVSTLNYLSSPFELIQGAWFFFKLGGDDTSTSTAPRQLQIGTDTSTKKNISYNGATVTKQGVLKGNILYKAVYDGTSYIVTNEEAAVPDISELTNVPVATNVAEGIMRLYDTVSGDSSDGSVTQVAINKALSSKADTGSVLTTSTTIEGVSYSSGTSFSHIATVTSAANVTAIKATLANFKLETGARAYLSFSSDETVTSTTTNRTLSINNTDAKCVYYNGQQLKRKFFKANILYEVIYDGKQYNVINPVDQKWYGECTTASGTTAKTATILGYTEIEGQKVSITFTNGSSVANATLNINNFGTRYIYYRGSKITKNNILAADGTYEFVFHDDKYILVGDLDTNTVTDSVEMNSATSSIAGIMRLYTDLDKSSTDGSVTQSAIKVALAAKANTESVISTATTIEGVSYDSSTSFSHLVSVTSLASESAITASLAGYKLVEGARVYLKFESDDASTVTGTARTLRINNTTAKYIYYNGIQVKTGKFFKAGIIYEMIYDGSCYNVINPADYKWYGSCTTASGTAAKTVTILSGYKEIAGQKITVTFTKGSSVANATLNVNGLGAKPIYYRGSAIAASNLLTANGTYEFVFDGTNYILIGDLDTNTIAEDVTIETATSSVAGVMKLYTDLSSSKTDGTVTQSAIKTALDGKLSTTTNVTQVAMSAAASSTNSEYPILFKNAPAVTNATATVLFESGVTINPSKSSISATTFKGTATSATSATSATQLASAQTIDGIPFNGTGAVSHYGYVASTVTAATTTKTVTGLTNINFTEGARVVIKFINGHTGASLTLKINNTNKTAKYNGSAIGSGIISENGTYEFVYDGSCFNLIGAASVNVPTATQNAAGIMKLYTTSGSNTDGTISQSVITDLLNNKINTGATVDNATAAAHLSSSNAINGIIFTGKADVTNYTTCSTAAATQAKVVTLASGTFSLKVGAQVTVKFTITNTAAKPKLNVNSTGALSIKYRGYEIPASALQANSIYTFVCTGTNSSSGAWEIVGPVLWTE